MAITEPNDDLLKSLGIIKDPDERYGDYYYISFDGYESSHIHRDTLPKLLEAIQRLIVEARINEIHSYGWTDEHGSLMPYVQKHLEELQALLNNKQEQSNG